MLLIHQGPGYLHIQYCFQIHPSPFQASTPSAATVCDNNPVASPSSHLHRVQPSCSPAPSRDARTTASIGAALGTIQQDDAPAPCAQLPMPSCALAAALRLRERRRMRLHHRAADEAEPGPAAVRGKALSQSSWKKRNQIYF
ncbi:hypothetical protein ACS0TY_020057 [Phlomoides rotata]